MAGAGPHSKSRSGPRDAELEMGAAISPLLDDSLEHAAAAQRAATRRAVVRKWVSPVPVSSDRTGVRAGWSRRGGDYSSRRSATAWKPRRFSFEVRGFSRGTHHLV